MDRELEPVVAHGARMSWAGLLRPGDEFPRALRSRLAVITSDSCPSLRRHFGSWSDRYRRFTSDLSSPDIEVEVVEPGETPSDGIGCVVHWVRREDLVHMGKGGVCVGDGWPVDLWKAFVGEMAYLPKGTVAEKLAHFLDSARREDEPAVAGWRRAVNKAKLVGSRGAAGRAWLPVPAKLSTSEGSGTCVFSWSPAAEFYPTLSEALDSPEGRLLKPDAASQARYYAECVLAKLHGVSFENLGDFLEDEGYAARPAVRRVVSPLLKLEAKRVGDSSMGPLGEFDRQ